MVSTNDREVALENEEIAVGRMYDLLKETPDSSVRIAYRDSDGDEQKVKWQQTEQAAKYLGDLIGFGEFDNRSPVGLPDSDRFIPRNISVEAEFGDKLQYEIEVEGVEEASQGYVCLDEDRNEYISNEDESYGHQDDYVSVVFSAESSLQENERKDALDGIVGNLEKE